MNTTLTTSLGLAEQHHHGSRLISSAAAAHAPVPPDPTHVPDWLDDVADHISAVGPEEWERTIHPLVEPRSAEARVHYAALDLRRALAAGADPDTVARLVAPYAAAYGQVAA